MLWGVSELVNARAFKPMLLCSACHENLLVRNFWSSKNRMKATLPKEKKMCFEKMLWGTSEMVNARTVNPLLLCSACHENLLVGISGALGTK